MIHYLSTAYSAACDLTPEQFDVADSEGHLTEQSRKVTCLACWWWIVFSPLGRAKKFLEET